MTSSYAPELTYFLARADVERLRLRRKENDGVGIMLGVVVVPPEGNEVGYIGDIRFQISPPTIWSKSSGNGTVFGWTAGSGTDFGPAIAALQAQLAALQAQLAALSAQVGANTAAITALQGQVAALSATIAGFNAAIAALQAQTNASFITATAEPLLPNHRRIVPTAGGGLGGTDNPGAQTYDLFVAANGVTNTMLADMPGLSVKVNPTGAAGDPQDLVAGADGLVLSTVGGAIVWAAAGGSPGLAAPFLTIGNTALLPNERAFTPTGALGFTDNGAGFTYDVFVNANGITNTLAADMAANTFKANPTAFAADPQDVAVGPNTVVGRAGGNIVAAQLVTAQVADDQITNPKLADMPALSVKVNPTGAAGDPTDLVAGGDGLVLSTVAGAIAWAAPAASPALGAAFLTIGNTALLTNERAFTPTGALGFTDNGPNSTYDVFVNADGITNLLLANMPANTIKANPTAALADPQDFAVGTNTVLGRVAGNIVAAQLVTAQVGDDQIDNTKLANMAALSVKANPTAGSADPQDVASVSDNTFFGRQAGVLGWFSIQTGVPGVAGNIYENLAGYVDSGCKREQPGRHPDPVRRAEPVHAGQCDRRHDLADRGAQRRHDELARRQHRHHRRCGHQHRHDRGERRRRDHHGRRQRPQQCGVARRQRNPSVRQRHRHEHRRWDLERDGRQLDRHRPRWLRQRPSGQLRRLRTRRRHPAHPRHERIGHQRVREHRRRDVLERADQSGGDGRDRERLLPDERRSGQRPAPDACCRRHHAQRPRDASLGPRTPARQHEHDRHHHHQPRQRGKRSGQPLPHCRQCTAHHPSQRHGADLAGFAQESTFRS